MLGMWVDLQVDEMKWRIQFSHEAELLRTGKYVTKIDLKERTNERKEPAVEQFDKDEAKWEWKEVNEVMICWDSFTNWFFVLF